MDEEKVISLVLDALRNNSIDVVSINLERTRDYLSMVEDKYYTFCRIKLNGRSPYLGLGISYKDRKLLSGNPKYSGIDLSSDKFVKFPIENYQDVVNLSDEIVMAYKWSYPPGNKTDLAFTELEGQFIDGFKALLNSSGLDENLVEIDRKSDKTLNFCYDSRQFGRIRLQGRKTRMQISDKNDMTWYENEPYDFYVENLPRWISYISTFK